MMSRVTGRIIWILVLFLAVLVATPSARGQVESVQRVYDLAGILSPEDTTRLERRAEIIADQAGVPTVIYIQRGPTDAEAALTDTGRVASILDAENALVVIVTVSSTSPRFGTVTFFVGRDLDDSGRLTVERLEEIHRDEMLRHLQAGRWVDGVNLGLSQVAYTLLFEIFPAPPRTSQQQTIANITRLPLNIAAILAVAIAGSLWLRIWRVQARQVAAVTAERDERSLDDLPPAVAGALVAGRLTDALPIATMLDLARRGAIAIEPTGRKQVQVRLRSDDGLRLPHETALWNGLVAVANGDGIVSNSDLQRLAGYWQPFQQALRAELEEQGWFDPKADSRRRSLQVAGGALLAGAVVMLIFTVAGRESWGFIGVGLLLASGLGSLIYSRLCRATTAEGESLRSAYEARITEFKEGTWQKREATTWLAVMPLAVALGAIPSVEAWSTGDASPPVITDQRDATPVATFLVAMTGGRAV